MPTIETASVDDAEVAAFLGEHLADMHALSPACSVHALGIDRLRGEGVRLWVARDGGRVVGSVALQSLDDGEVELKSMRVDPASRGTGLGRALLEHAIAAATEAGAARMLLETGSESAFAPARALYARRGFVERAPFGSYALDPNSVYMVLELA